MQSPVPVSKLPEPDTASPLAKRENGKPPRQRRTREDVIARIRDAAAALFAEKGYAGTTTREIAERAAVSETLLFRHFGGKAALFDHVVCVPFEAAIHEFAERRRELGDDVVLDVDEPSIYASVYGLFEDNTALLGALMTAPLQRNGEAGSLPSDSRLGFFREATEQQLSLYRRSGEQPPFDVGIATRLSFGMMAASVLFHDWLFPDLEPSREEILATLRTLLARGLMPAAGRPQPVSG
jgi:AcrR family transcriptional regulator